MTPDPIILIDQFIAAGHYVEIRSLEPGVVVIRNPDNPMADWKEVRATLTEALQKAWDAKQRGWKV